MKKWFGILFTVLALFGLTACGGDQPEDVAKDYMQAMFDGDINTAAKLVYLSDKDLAKPGIENDVQGKLQMMVGDLKRKTDELGGVDKITAEKAEINAEDPSRARVKVSVKFKKSDDVKTENVSLRKNTKDEWKVKL